MQSNDKTCTLCTFDTSTATIRTSGRVENMRFHKIENHLEWIINFGFCVTHNPSRTEPAARATGETTIFAITVISARSGGGRG